MADAQLTARDADGVLREEGFAGEHSAFTEAEATTVRAHGACGELRGNARTFDVVCETALLVYAHRPHPPHDAGEVGLRLNDSPRASGREDERGRYGRTRVHSAGDEHSPRLRESGRRHRDVPREDAFRDSERGGENRRVLFRLFRHCRAFLDAFEGASTIYTPHGPLREDIRTVRRRSENVSNSEAHRVDALVYLRRTSVKSGTTGIQPRDVAVSTA